MEFKTIHAMPPIQLRLTHSEDKLRKWREELTGRAPDDGPSTSAATYTYECGSEIVFVVYMTPFLDYPASSDAALLAHESVHIAQAYLSSIGEDNPGDEELAYIVQYVSEQLIEKHFKWKRKRL